MTKETLPESLITAKETPSEVHVMSKPAETNDMGRLRDLLFGEQALQTDDRFDALEVAINSLRRENRNLRQALEIEAMARIKEAQKQTTHLTKDLNHSMVDLVHILSQHVQDEKAKRVAQAQTMADTLTAYQKSQDDVTGQLITHLQKEQEVRAAQFSQLRQVVETDAQSQNTAADTLADMLSSFAKTHQTRQESNVSQE